MRVTRVSIVLVVLLAACQTASYQGNENSPFYIIPAGSELTLNRPIAFRPDEAAVYIQDGHLLPITDVEVYSPFCRFELRHRVDAARTIEPDQITITSASQQRISGTYSRARSPYLPVAAFTQVAQMGSGGAGGVPLYSFVTFMNLHSDKQPEILQLACLRWAFPGNYDHVTINEMRRTLAPLFSLHTPAGR